MPLFSKVTKVKVDVANLKTENRFSDQYGEPLMPDDHEFYSMPPCDNSDASKITAKDKSRSSVRHNSLQFNTNLRRHMAEFIPGFGDDEYTNSSTIKYSWCWNSKDRVGIFYF